MALVFTKNAETPGAIQSLGSLFALVGTITVSGSYATGGDSFASGLNLEDYLKRIGRGKVLFVDMSRGLQGEWDATAKLLKLFTAGGAELGAGAYAAAYTATPIPCFVIGR